MWEGWDCTCCDELDLPQSYIYTDTFETKMWGIKESIEWMNCDTSELEDAFMYIMLWCNNFESGDAAISSVEDILFLRSCMKTYMKSYKRCVYIKKSHVNPTKVFKLLGEFLEGYETDIFNVIMDFASKLLCETWAVSGSSDDEQMLSTYKKVLWVYTKLYFQCERYNILTASDIVLARQQNSTA